MGKTNGKWAFGTKGAKRAAGIAFALCVVLGGAAGGGAAGAGATSARATLSKDDATAEPDATLPAALCQVVYPLDQTPEQGYRYMFLGNAFFINEDGYLVTAAHLLSYFKHGGEPYILVGPREGSKRMIEAPIVAADWEHDVAVLRATPNPFKGANGGGGAGGKDAAKKGGGKIGYLALSAETPEAGSAVMSASLRPANVEDAHTVNPPLEDFSRGAVIRYQLYRERGVGERELLLYDGQVVAGQSGSPLVSAETHGVVGVVVGRWLHPAVIPSGADSAHETISPGAALRIHYAIGLLEQEHVAWHMASAAGEISATDSGTATGARAAAANAASNGSGAGANAGTSAAGTEQTKGFTAPAPLSVVPTRYPPQALFGGEVMLDAQVETSGKIGDVRVMTGDAPFLEPVMEAVRTWTFTPARMDGRAVEARIGIVFQFPQSFLPHVAPRQHKHPEAQSKDTRDHAALPTMTTEPEYPAMTTADGSVAFYGVVEAEGELSGVSVLRDIETLTAPVMAAAQHWTFAAGERNGEKADSALVVVVTFRRPVT